MRTPRPLVVGALAGFLLSVAPLTGTAHAATRVSAVPEAGSLVRPPTAVAATYDVELNSLFSSTITVTGPAPATTTVCAGSAAGGYTVSCAPAARLADGRYDVVVSGREQRLPAAAFADSWSFTVDGTAPSAPFSLVVEPATFAAASTSLLVRGTAEPAASVVVVATAAGTSRSGVATAGPDGAFAVDVADPAGLPDGTLRVTATATDRAGNASPPSAEALAHKDTVRPAAPAVDALARPVGAADAASVVLTGRLPAPTAAAPLERGAVVHLRLDDEDAATPPVVATPARVADDGTWRSEQVDVRSLADGGLTVTATAEDAAGNRGPAGSGSLVKDVTPAPAPGVDALPPVRADAASAYVVTGSGEAGARAQLAVTDGSRTVTGEESVTDGGRWTARLDLTPLADGPLELRAVVRDTAGNPSAETRLALQKDTVVPVVTDLAATPTSRATTTSTASGTTEPGSQVWLAVQSAGGAHSPLVSATAGPDGRFSAQLDLSGLPDGPAVLRVAARDGAGNAGPEARLDVVHDAVDVPGPPATPGARAGDRAVRVLLNGLPDDGGSPTTSWRVTSPDDAAVGVTVGGAATSALVSGLVNGRAYRFVVQASNAEGPGEPSPPSAAVVPRGATRTTLVGPASSVSGSPLRLTGSVVRTWATGPVAGTRVVVTARYDDGRSRVIGTVGTSSSGAWSLTTTPTQNAVYTAAAAAKGPDAASVSAGRRVLSATRIAVNAPATGRARTALVVTGRTTPAKPGATVTLLQVRRGGSEVRLAGATVRADGTFRIARALPRGSYVLVVRIGPTRFNTKGASPRFAVRRT